MRQKRARRETKRAKISTKGKKKMTSAQVENRPHNLEHDKGAPLI